MLEAIPSSKMSVLTKATRHHIPEYGILHDQWLFKVLIQAWLPERIPCIHVSIPTVLN
jgi:hypothetical protein